MRDYCRICGSPLVSAERSIGTCIQCVNGVRYSSMTVKEPGYRYGPRRPQQPAENRDYPAKPR